MSKPTNGTIVKCCECGLHHRLSTPVNKNTGAMVHTLMVVVCQDLLQIAWDGKKLSTSLEIVHSFGDEAEKDEFFPVDPEFEDCQPR